MSPELGCFYVFKVFLRSEKQVVVPDCPGVEPIIMPAKAVAMCCGPKQEENRCSLRYVGPGFRGHCGVAGQSVQFSAPCLEKALQVRATQMGYVLSFD
ncbi:hypothetical protein KKD62_03210 [Patescibacteria group bacterium]|nr:hypothetical protein [Patescibacteria group bacterium]MBU1931528.1 hypothetical protein [Patescibacteria group bacterium]